MAGNAVKAKGSRKQSSSGNAGAAGGRRPEAGGQGEDCAADAGGIFDLARVRRLIAMMKRHDLAEIDLRHGDQQVRIRRGPEGGAFVMPSAAMPAAPAAAAVAAPAAAGPPLSDARMLVVKSPMVGTFYRASGPDAAPFVKVGDRIGPDQTVCIVEAMKVFNEIPSGVSGQVVAVLVENGAAVEFGQPLIKVDPEA
jgi:acetyl-CoA carboxylase biotin carboxyl carrier protein